MRLPHRILVGTIIAVALAFPLPAAGQHLIDQEQPNTGRAFSNIGGRWNGQTFVHGAPTLSGFGVYMSDYSSTGSAAGTLSLSIWTEVDAATRTLVHSADLFVSLATGEQRWVDLFWSPIVLGDNTLYAEIAGTDGLMPAAVHSAGGDLYAAGTYQYNPSMDPGSYMTFGNEDMTFRSFTQAPEPLSLLLLGSGLAGVGAARTRRGRRKDDAARSA